MIDSLCIIGHPSPLGGADTELDHQIHCWQAIGIEVHICPTGPLDDVQQAMKLEERGCIYHRPKDWPSLEGMHCISFCNGEFLKHAERIKRYARSTSFVNCMSWNFDGEIEGQARGYIDFHLYQTQHSFEKVRQKLKDLGTYRPQFFKPYFHTEEFPYIDDRPQDKFRFGRISRDDGDKFGARQLWIYETMTAPVLKEGPMYNHLCGHRDFPPAAGTEYDRSCPLAQCPSDIGIAHNRFYGGYAISNYPAVHAGGIRAVYDDLNDKANGVFGEATSVSLTEITDGLKNTLLIGERALRPAGNVGAIWMRSINRAGDGDDGTALAGVCDSSATINDFTNPDAFSSNHVGGAHFVLADGSVQFFAESIDPTVYERLAGINDD